MNQNIINHIMFVIDESGSMASLTKPVEKVFNDQVQWLAQRSRESGQETRITLFTFNGDHGNVCHIYDQDVFRTAPIDGIYRPNGGTPLIESTLQAIASLKKTPEEFGDHSFLVYVVTDGEETQSHHLAGRLNKEVTGLPENWTLAVFVPNQTGVFEAKRFGFPAENIAIWDTTSVKGLESASTAMKEATSRYMTGRAQGVRGSKTMFRVDTAGLSQAEVKENLTKLSKSQYKVLEVTKDATIRDFVDGAGIAFVKGSAYYQLTKPETVQAAKQICIVDRKHKNAYTGAEARTMLGLPNAEIRVTPGKFVGFDIFVQSTSVNRRLVAGTKLLVMV